MEGRLRDKKVEGEKKPTRYFSDKQEKSVASRLRGKQTANSGATPFSKGDVLLEDVLMECKTKTKDSESFTIHKEWIDKNTREALVMGKKYGAIAFNFGPNQPNYYIIDEELMEILIDKLKRNEGA